MIRATGFVSGGSKAKVCFSHIGCSFCEAALTPYFNDSFYLSGYVPCSGVAHLGTRPEHHEVELLQDGISQTVSLESQAFPILSEELVAESTRFSVQIERKRFTFHHSPQDITGHSGAGQAASASHGVAAVSSGPAAPTVAPPVLSAAPAAPATGTDSPSPPSVAPPIFPTAAALMMDERSRTLGESRDSVPVNSSSGPVSQAARALAQAWRYFFSREMRADSTGQSSVPPQAEAPSTRSRAVPAVPQVRPGHGARVGMFSARFDGGEIEQRFRRIHEILAQSGYDIMMVGVHPGETFGVPTTRYLGRLYRERGVMLCVCTEHYGEMTSSHFSSFEELIFAKTYEAFIKIVPLRMGAVYPPMPPGRGANGPNRPDHLDEHLDGQSFATSVFNPARLYLDCREKSDVEIAAAIAECLHH